MAAITPALITALNTAYRRDFQASLANSTTLWDRVATQVPSTSAKNTYAWLSRFPAMREWIGPRVIKDMAATAYEIVNKTWESTVGISRDEINDDEHNTYGPLFQQMGADAAEQPDRVLWPMLAAGNATVGYDGQFFFDTDHPVYPNADGTGVPVSVSNITAGAGTPWYVMATKRPLKPLIYQSRRAPEFETKFDPSNSDHVFLNNEFLWGSSTRFNVGFGLWQLAHRSAAALNSDNLFAAIEAMMSVKRDGGSPMGVMPDLLVVPPSLEAEATKTIKVMLNDTGGSNPTFQRLDVLTVPWLA